jgi:hypothetical protein
MYRFYGSIKKTWRSKIFVFQNWIFWKARLFSLSQVPSLSDSTVSITSASNGVSNGRHSNKQHRIRTSNITGEQDVDTCFGCGLTGQLIACQMSKCSRKFHPKCIKVKGQSMRHRSPTRNKKNNFFPFLLLIFMCFFRTLDMSITSLWCMWHWCQYRLCWLFKFILWWTSNKKYAWHILFITWTWINHILVENDYYYYFLFCMVINICVRCFSSSLDCIV